MKRCFTAAVLFTAFTVSTLVCVSAAQTLTTTHSKSNPVTVPQGTFLVAELAKSIDSRKAKAGDMVRAKVTQDVIANGHVVIRRGSKLLGHITEAKASWADEPESILGVVFDSVKPKGGEEMSFNGVLQAVAPPVPVPDVLSGTSAAAYGGGSAAGAVNQQVSRGSSRQTLIDPRQVVDHTREDALNSAADISSYGIEGNVLHNGFLGSGNRGVFGMRGVSLKSETGHSGPMLVSTKGDIKLESGTQMVLGVTGQPRPSASSN